MDGDRWMDASAQFWSRPGNKNSLLRSGYTSTVTSSTTSFPSTTFVTSFFSLRGMVRTGYVNCSSLYHGSATNDNDSQKQAT